MCGSHLRGLVIVGIAIAGALLSASPARPSLVRAGFSPPFAGRLKPAPAYQVRDLSTAAPTPSGTAVLSGTIVTEDASAKPLRRVSVRLASSNSSVARVAITDDSGRFAFPGLPAGGFTLTATKGGYVNVFYGSRRQGPAVLHLMRACKYGVPGGAPPSGHVRHLITVAAC